MTALASAALRMARFVFRSFCLALACSAAMRARADVPTPRLQTKGTTGEHALRKPGTQPLTTTDVADGSAPPSFFRRLLPQHVTERVNPSSTKPPISSAGLVDAPTAVAMPLLQSSQQWSEPPLLPPSNLLNGEPVPLQQLLELRRPSKVKQTDYPRAKTLIVGPEEPVKKSFEIVGITGSDDSEGEGVVAGEVSDTEGSDPLLDVVAVGNDVRFHCTGVLVSPRAVLTARHCLPATRVLFGNYVSQPLIAIRSRTALTPKGNEDVAILVLDTSASVPLRAWHAAGDGTPPRMGKIAGFGANDSAATKGAGRKRFARIPITGWGCDVSRARTTGCSPGFEMIVVAPGGIDTCDGDSGGPLFERVGGNWRLLGITSRPLASSRKRCGDGGIYTRVDKVAEWLRVALKQLGTSRATIEQKR